jgi:hypothetical protein
MRLVFTNSASAPEDVQLITDFEPFKSETANGVVLFRTPNNSSTTSGFLSAAPEVDIAAVTDTHPAGGQGAGNALPVLCDFIDPGNPWLRLTTAGTATLPNPVINLTRKLQFDIYADKPVRVAVGCSRNNDFNRRGHRFQRRHDRRHRVGRRHQRCWHRADTRARHRVEYLDPAHV